MTKLREWAGLWALWARLLLKLPPTLLFHLLLVLTIVQVPAYTEVHPSLGAGLLVAVLLSGVAFAMIAGWGSRPKFKF